MIKRFPENNWIHPSELPRIMAAMQKGIADSGLRWLGNSDCKYVTVYIDQRNGAFLIKTSTGIPLSNERIYELWPELRDDYQGMETRDTPRVDPEPEQG
mgnify:CR=1 FL=1